MPKAAIPVSTQSTAVGLSLRKVQVLQVVLERGIAIVSDKMNFYAQVPYRSQPGAGRIPREDDVWLIDRSTGNWNFSRYLAKDDTDLTTMVGPITVEGDLFVTGNTSVFDLFVENDFAVQGGSTFEGGVTTNGLVHANDAIHVAMPNEVNNAITTGSQADGYPRFVVQADGRLSWGPGGTLQDAAIWRDSYYHLKTDATWDAANFPSGAWQYLYPSWTTSTGAVTPSFGNAGVQLWWTRIARTIMCQFEFVFGTTTSYNGGSGADNWRFGLPVQAAQVQDCVGFADAQASTSHRVTCRVAILTVNTFALDVCSGAVDGVALVNNGQLDALTPWVWFSNSNYIIRGSFQYQAYNDAGF